MASKAFKNGVELRQRLQQARPGETIRLPLKESDCGEYEGTFLITKPLSLVGLGSKTPLLGKGRPALVVAASGVKLKDLELSDSFDRTGGAALVVLEKAQPVLENVAVIGKKVVMSTEQLIDLGDFLPQQQTSSYLEVEVSGPAQIKCAGNSAKWLAVWPDALPAAGKYLLQFTCNAKALGADAFAAGSVEIATAKRSQTLWVTVHVLSAAPAKLLGDPVVLSYGKDQRIRFLDGFVVGKAKFPGFAPANAIAERQAILLKDGESNHWALFQPWPTPTPTLVNGQPIAPGQRCLLLEGSLIRAGNLELKAETFSGTRYYSVNKAQLDLGAPGQPPVDAGFQLRYLGSGKDKAKLIVTVPWLQVSPTELDFRKDEIKDVRVTLTSAAAALPPIKHRERGAILVQSKNETLSLDASVDLSAAVPPQPQAQAPQSTPPVQAPPKQAPVAVAVPKIRAAALDFGEVAGWETTPAKTLPIFNDGQKDWDNVQVSSNVGWLSVSPAKLSVPQGGKAELHIQLNEQLDELASGRQDLPEAIRLSGGGLEIPIGVKLSLPPFGLEINHREVGFAFDEATDLAGLRQKLIVTNSGRRNWAGQITTQEPGLEVTPNQAVIHVGGTLNIAVSLKPPIRKLGVGEHLLRGAVSFEHTALALDVRIDLQKKTVAVESPPKVAPPKATPPLVVVEPPKVVTEAPKADWVVYPEGFTFGSVERSSRWEATPPQELTIRNPSDHEISLTITINAKGAQWLEAPGLVKVPPRAERKLKATLKPGVWSGLKLGKQEGVIDVSGAGKQLHLITTLELTPAKSGTLITGAAEKPPVTATQGLQVTPLRLAFTETDPTKWRSVAAQQVEVKNPGGSRLAGIQAGCVEWLTVEPKNFDLPAYGKIDLQVRLKPSAFVRAGEVRTEDKPDAVTVGQGGETYSIHVSVSANAPQPTVQPPPPPAAEPPPPSHFEPATEETKPEPPPTAPRKPSLFGPRPAQVEEPAPTPMVQPSQPQSKLFGAKPAQPAAPVSQPEAALEVQPLRLDFGRVMDWAQAAAQTVTLTNPGALPVEVEISTVNWLKPTLTTLTCPAHDKAEFQVALLKPRGVFAQPTRGLQRDLNGITIKAGARTIALPVEVETL